MPPQTSQPSPVELPTNKRRFRLAGGWRLVSFLLLVALIASVVLWKPWQANIKAGDRTVSVTGDAIITAQPDQYIFTPTYEFSDPKTGLSDMTKKSDEVIAKLKTLGVADNKIQSSSYGSSDSGCNYCLKPVLINDGSNSYSLSLTVTVDNRDLAQKVQDYLLTTSPGGSISPQYSFSTDKQKQLESQGRDKAEKDARSKADQSAKNLGFKLGKVKSIEDGSLYGDPLPLQSLQSGASADTKSSPTLAVQPGENDISYSVTVVYFIH